MIIILFPAGAFGSTMEYSLRKFSNELTTVQADILDNGSMHSFNKEFHPITIAGLEKIKDSKFEVITPVYPGHDYLSPVATILEFKKFIKPDQKVLLIYLTDTADVERNCLFCYYKVTEQFLDSVLKDKPKEWNLNHTSYRDMQPFELREALSFYVDGEIEKTKVSNVIEEH